MEWAKAGLAAGLGASFDASFDVISALVLAGTNPQQYSIS
jgi:hypothetical protein